MWPISALLVELVGVAGFEPATLSSRTGSGPAEFATILLPNYSVRGGTRQHQGDE
jgi:hypothetical protein